MYRPRAGRSVAPLAAATVGVYVLIMAGATAAVVDAVTACSAWPTCAGSGLSLDDPALFVAWAHRIVALVVGVLVLWSTASAWASASRLVRLSLVCALGLFPVQVAIGARVALQGPTSFLTGVHLLVGMVIFVALVVALAIELRASANGSTIPAEAAPGERSPGPDYRAPTPVTGDTRAGEPVEGSSASPAPSPSGLRHTVLAYVRLTKPRLMWLLCLVAAAGMALAAGPALTVEVVVATLLGGVLAIGASGTFNHVLERDLDRRMHRTADRPIATEQVGVRNAFAFGTALAAAAVLVFATINVLAAALGIAAIAYYSVVYTLLLKPNTVQNTVIGGLAGAFPAFIGAAAATNTVGAPALVLGLLIFLWTPAHFYNLALVYREDYERGGVPMFPVVRGEVATRTHILGYLAASLLAAVVLAAVGGLGPVYAVTAVVVGTIFLWTVVDLHRRPTRATAWRSFHASNAFLGAILLAVVVDALAV